MTYLNDNPDQMEVGLRVMVHVQQSDGSNDQLARTLNRDFGVKIRPQTLAKMDEGQLIAHIMRNKP